MTLSVCLFVCVSAIPHMCVAVPLSVSPCLCVRLRVRASLRVSVCVCVCRSPCRWLLVCISLHSAFVPPRMALLLCLSAYVSTLLSRTMPKSPGRWLPVRLWSGLCPPCCEWLLLLASVACAPPLHMPCPVRRSSRQPALPTIQTLTRLPGFPDDRRPAPTAPVLVRLSTHPRVHAGVHPSLRPSVSPSTMLDFWYSQKSQKRRRWIFKVLGHPGVWDSLLTLATPGRHDNVWWFCWLCDFM